jgi:hypothetical protein
MNEAVLTYIRVKNIDSFQKLRLLLYLYQHPQLKGTSQDLANRLHLADIPLIEKIIADLQQAGLIDRVENYYKLPDEPEVRLQLQHLARAFEHPLTRQELLKQVKPAAAFNHLQEIGVQPRLAFN